MSITDFTKAHSLFIDAVTSKSVFNVRQRLKQMKVLDEDLARDCCLKTISKVSEENDYSSLVKDIIDSQLFDSPHHQSLQSVVPTLVFNAVRLCDSTITFNKTLSHLASRLKLNIVETLNIVGEDGYSVLHLCVINGQFEAAKLILELGADCNRKSDIGNSAISLAIAYRHYSLVPLLLSYKSDVNTQDSDHDTPLMFAAWNKAPKIVSALIQQGANIDGKNKYGSTPIWNAVYKSSAECVLILLSHNSLMDVPCDGTDLFFNESDCHDKITKLYPGHKRSLLWVAVDRLGISEESLKVLLILLEAGYDVTKEHWLRRGNQQSVDCPNILQENPALLDMLLFLYMRPLNLKDLCRNTLRKYHRQSYLSFHEWLRRLHLPSTITSFLKLSYMVH